MHSSATYSAEGSRAWLDIFLIFACNFFFPRQKIDKKKNDSVKYLHITIIIITPLNNLFLCQILRGDATDPSTSHYQGLSE